MGSSGSKKEEERKTRINIIKGENIEKDIEQKENERVIPGNANYINNDHFGIIGQQKDKSICKIIKNENPIGTGFLCYIIGEYKNKIKTLINAYHVLGEKDLKIGNKIKLIFNDNKRRKRREGAKRRIK